MRNMIIPLATVQSAETPEVFNVGNPQWNWGMMQQPSISYDPEGVEQYYRMAFFLVLCDTYDIAVGCLMRNFFLICSFILI